MILLQKINVAVRVLVILAVGGFNLCTGHDCLQKNTAAFVSNPSTSFSTVSVRSDTSWRRRGADCNSSSGCARRKLRYSSEFPFQSQSSKSGLFNIVKREASTAASSESDLLSSRPAQISSTSSTKDIDDNGEPKVKVSVSIIGDAFVDLLCFLESDGAQMNDDDDRSNGDDGKQKRMLLPVEAGGDTLLNRPITPMAGGSGINTATHLRSFFNTCGDEEVGVELQTVLNNKDEYGRILTEHASQIGFSLENRLGASDTSLISGALEATGHCVVIVADGERTFLTHRGSVEHFDAADIDLESLIGEDHDDAAADDLTTKTESCGNTHKHIHIAGYYSMPKFWGGKLKEKLVKVKERRNERQTAAAPNGVNCYTTISLVPQYDASQEWDGQLIDLLPCVDYLILSEGESRSITKTTKDATLEEVAKILYEASPETTTIVTRGEHGAVALQRGKVLHCQDAAFVEHPMDPTGAGDAFAAGFLGGVLNKIHTSPSSEEFSHDIIHNDDVIQYGLRWGCAVGTASILSPGASSPSSEEQINTYLL